MVPGIFGPTIEEVYLMISVSGGRRTPKNEDESPPLKIKFSKLILNSSQKDYQQRDDHAFLRLFGNLRFKKYSWTIHLNKLELQ